MLANKQQHTFTLHHFYHATQLC